MSRSPVALPFCSPAGAASQPGGARFCLQMGWVVGNHARHLHRNRTDPVDRVVIVHWPFALLYRPPAWKPRIGRDGRWRQVLPRGTYIALYKAEGSAPRAEAPYRIPEDWRPPEDWTP
jgi:hypothetical protein